MGVILCSSSVFIYAGLDHNCITDLRGRLDRRKVEVLATHRINNAVDANRLVVARIVRGTDPFDRVRVRQVNKRGVGQMRVLHIDVILDRNVGKLYVLIKK